jgi:dihydrofolate reductase
MRLTLHAFLTLDGVMQAPGAPDEDLDGGFEHGGWSFPYADEDFGTTMVGWFASAGAFLLGRRTYEIFAGFWPKVTDPADPIATRLNSLPKYVASTTLGSLDWAGSSLLEGDVPDEVAKLKQEPGNELQVHGSCGLGRALIEHGLVDEYRLLFFPLHLGSGKKLFGDGVKAATLRLTSTKTTSGGVVIATYQPAGPVRHGSFTAVS